MADTDSIELPIGYDFGDANAQLGAFGAGIDALTTKAQAATAAFAALVGTLTGGNGIGQAANSLATFNVKIDQSSKTINDSRSIVQNFNKTINDIDNSVTNVTKNVTNMGAAVQQASQQIASSSPQAEAAISLWGKGFQARTITREFSEVMVRA